MKLNPFWAGFVKQLLMVIVIAVVSFLGDSTHLAGIMSPALALIVASVFSGVESSMKSNSDGTKALFGAVSVKK